jgi:hypothetical protein
MLQMLSEVAPHPRCARRKTTRIVVYAGYCAAFWVCLGSVLYFRYVMGNPNENKPHEAELGTRDGNVLGARQDEAVHAAPRRVGRRTPIRRDAPRERRQPQAQPPGAAGGAGVSRFCDLPKPNYLIQIYTYANPTPANTRHMGDPR